MNKLLITMFCLVIVIAVAGCTGKTEYVCPDGSTVSDSSLCHIVEETEVEQDQNSRNIVTQEVGVSKESSKEDPINNLEVIDVSCKYGDYGWIYTKGRVKNTGATEVTYVKVNIDLFNGDEWVDSGYTYVKNTDIPAGAIESWEKTWTDDSMIFTRCEVYLT